jgi:hypothetical protein
LRFLQSHNVERQVKAPDQVDHPAFERVMEAAQKKEQKRRPLFHFSVLYFTFSAAQIAQNLVLASALSNPLASRATR